MELIVRCYGPPRQATVGSHRWSLQNESTRRHGMVTPQPQPASWKEQRWEKTQSLEKTTSTWLAAGASLFCCHPVLHPGLSTAHLQILTRGSGWFCRAVHWDLWAEQKALSGSTIYTMLGSKSRRLMTPTAAFNCLFLYFCPSSRNLQKFDHRINTST